MRGRCPSSAGCWTGAKRYPRGKEHRGGSGLHGVRPTRRSVNPLSRSRSTIPSAAFRGEQAGPRPGPSGADCYVRPTAPGDPARGRPWRLALRNPRRVSGGPGDRGRCRRLRLADVRRWRTGAARQWTTRRRQRHGSRARDARSDPTRKVRNTGSDGTRTATSAVTVLSRHGLRRSEVARDQEPKPTSTSASFRANTASSTAYSASSIAGAANWIASYASASAHLASRSATSASCAAFFASIRSRMRLMCWCQLLWSSFQWARSTRLPSLN